MLLDDLSNNPNPNPEDYKNLVQLLNVEREKNRKLEADLKLARHKAEKAESDDESENEQQNRQKER